MKINIFFKTLLKGSFFKHSLTSAFIIALNYSVALLLFYSLNSYIDTLYILIIIRIINRTNTFLLHSKFTYKLTNTNALKSFPKYLLFSLPIAFFTAYLMNLCLILTEIEFWQLHLIFLLFFSFVNYYVNSRFIFK